MSGVSKGTFALNTSTGNQIVSTGLSSAPTLVLLWVTAQTTAGYGAGVRVGMGAAANDGGTLTQQAQATASDDAAATTNTGIGTRTNRCLFGYSDGTPTTDFEISIVSMNADGSFTINVVDAPTSGWLVHYMAFDSTVIAKANAARFTQPGSTGNQAITGIGFDPDLLLSMFANVNTTDLNRADNFTLGFGATDGTNQWCGAFRDRDAQAASVGVSDWETSYYISSPTGVGGINYRYSIVSLDADGFTHNCVTFDTSYTQTPIVICAKLATGASVQVGNDTQNTSTGTKATTTAFQPDALLFGAFMQTGTGPDITPAGPALMLGGFDGSNQGAVTISSVNGAGPSDANESTSGSVALRMTEGAQTTLAEATVSAVGATSFTLDWTTADAIARTFGFVAFKAAESFITDEAPLRQGISPMRWR